jgi:hypothetical protein
MPPPEEYVLPTSEAWDRTSAAVRYTEGRRASQGGRPVPGTGGGGDGVIVAVTGGPMTTIPGAAAGSFQPCPGYFLHADDLSLGYLPGDPCYVRRVGDGPLTTGVQYRGQVVGVYNALAVVVVGGEGNACEHVRVTGASSVGPGGVVCWPGVVDLFSGTVFSDGTPVWLVQRWGATLTADGTGVYVSRGYPVAITISGDTRPVYVTTMRPYMVNWACVSGAPQLSFNP